MLTDITANRQQNIWTLWRETRKKQCFPLVRSNVSPQHSGNVGPTFVQRSLFCVSFPSFHSWLNVCRRERKYRSCVQRASFVYILSSDERQFYRDTEWMKTTFSRFPLCFWYYFLRKEFFRPIARVYFWLWKIWIFKPVVWTSELLLSELAGIIASNWTVQTKI